MNFFPKTVLPTRTSTSDWFLPWGTSSLRIFLSWEIALKVPKEFPPQPLGKFLHQLVPFLGHDHAQGVVIVPRIVKDFAYNFPYFHDMPTQQVRSFYLLYCVDTLCALTSSMMKADGFHSIISPQTLTFNVDNHNQIFKLLLFSNKIQVTETLFCHSSKTIKICKRNCSR